MEDAAEVVAFFYSLKRSEGQRFSVGASVNVFNDGHLRQLGRLLKNGIQEGRRRDKIADVPPAGDIEDFDETRTQLGRFSAA
jgi:hypothetical protein